jgi:hypothetical protein
MKQEWNWIASSISDGRAAAEQVSLRNEPPRFALPRLARRGSLGGGSPHRA